MKSNEEFIAGIYEKAAVYTEEKETKIVKVNFSAGAMKIAAMVAVCIGLAGVGSIVLGNGNSIPNQVPQPAREDYGIALTSELGEEDGEAVGGAAQFRIGPVMETVTFTGVVKQVAAEEKRICLELIFDESAPEYTEGSIVYIRWDMLEPLSKEIKVGTTLTATGVLSEYDGCAELVLNDSANLEMK